MIWRRPVPTSPTFPELSGKRAIVTGAGSGIGRAMAVALARQGVRVAVCDINLDAARHAATEIGGGAVEVAIDVSKRASVEMAFTSVETLFGGYDILIANAGVSSMQHAVDITDEEWDFNFSVNTRGVFLTNQIAARRFIAQGAGTIVNTASLAAKISCATAGSM